MMVCKANSCEGCAMGRRKMWRKRSGIQDLESDTMKEIFVLHLPLFSLNIMRSIRLGLGNTIYKDT